MLTGNGSRNKKIKASFRHTHIQLSFVVHPVRAEEKRVLVLIASTRSGSVYCCCWFAFPVSRRTSDDRLNMSLVANTPVKSESDRGEQDLSGERGLERNLFEKLQLQNANCFTQHRALPRIEDKREKSSKC